MREVTETISLAHHRERIRRTKIIVNTVKIRMERPWLTASSACLTDCQAWTTPACCCLRASKSFNYKLSVSESSLILKVKEAHAIGSALRTLSQISQLVDAALYFGQQLLRIEQEPVILILLARIFRCLRVGSLLRKFPCPSRFETGRRRRPGILCRLGH